MPQSSSISSPNLIPSSPIRTVAQTALLTSLHQVILHCPPYNSFLSLNPTIQVHWLSTHLHLVLNLLGFIIWPHACSMAYLNAKFFPHLLLSKFLLRRIHSLLQVYPRLLTINPIPRPSIHSILLTYLKPAFPSPMSKLFPYSMHLPLLVYINFPIVSLILKIVYLKSIHYTFIHHLRSFHIHIDHL